MYPTSWTLTTFALCLAALATTVAPPPAAADWDEEEKIPIVESIPLDGAQRIELSFHVGELSIEHGPADVIEIEGDVVIKSHSRRKIERLREELELKIENGETISIHLEPNSGITKGYGIDLTVRVPQGVDLDVSLGIGELNAEIALPASARFDLGIGELDIDVPEGTAAQINASVGIGEVDVDGFTEQGTESRRRHLLGARYDGTIGNETNAADYVLRADVNIGEVSVDERSFEG